MYTQQKRRWEIPTKYGVTALTQKCHLIWSACPTSCTGFSPTYTSGTGPLEMVGQHHCIWWGSIKLLLTLFKFKTIFLKQLT